jgi:glycosyltransferase involved in cell wall biosynthesis
MENLQFCFVDNNSSDDSAKIIREYGHEIFCETDIQNADAARNRALIEAKGEIIAFTDADCLPAKDWVESGVRNLHGCDILTGKIAIYSKHSETPAELYDKLTNLRHDISVAERSVAFTANLFVRRRVFKRVGFFKPFCGGDYEFTADAVAAGFQLRYSPDPLVMHPARPLRELLAKAFRIGKEKGTAPIRINGLQKADRPHFRHLRPKYLRASIANQKFSVNNRVFWCCYSTGILYLTLGLIGYVVGKLSVSTNRHQSIYLKQKKWI